MARFRFTKPTPGRSMAAMGSNSQPWLFMMTLAIVLAMAGYTCSRLSSAPSDKPSVPGAAPR